MWRNRLWAGFILFAVAAAASPCSAQGTNFDKNFKLYKGLIAGVDFFAANQTATVPFQKPVREARERLVSMLGPGISSGAIVICSSIAERDSVSEARVLRKGYKWVLIQLTPEASAQERLEQMKARMGGEISPELLARFTNRTPEMNAQAESRMVAGVVQRMAHAMIFTTLNPEWAYRSSRLDDMGKSPLPDWLDIGLASYASRGATNLRFLQDRLEEAFPLEEMLAISRPFVAPSTNGGSPSGAFTIRMQGGPGEGGGAGGTGGGGRSGGQGMGSSPGSGGGRGAGMNMPKDVQDRMMFDGQASALFSYLLQKRGADKVRDLANAGQKGGDLRAVLMTPEWLGSDPEKAEIEWYAWIRAQKSESQGPIRVISGGPGQPPPQ